MYALKSIREALEKIAALAQQVEQIRSDENRAEIKARYPETPHDPYPSMFGQLSAVADMAARSATYALKYVAEAERELDPMERLQSVMENFDVMANVGWNGKEDNTRELRLLEILCKSDDYTYERKQLYKSISDTLGEVEDAEWERERDEAVNALESAGFLHVERDDFEGWERGDEHVTINLKSDQYHRPQGYTFLLERSNQMLVFGVSGEFHKLLEAIQQPSPITASKESAV